MVPLLTVDDVIGELARVLPASYKAITLGGTRRLASYALCTDADFRTLYGAGYRSEDARKFSAPELRFLPAEWPLKEYSALAPASEALERWMDQNYAREGDDIEPGDDHLRPWKRRTFEEAIEVLSEFRKSGLIRDETALWITCHDPNDAMVDWIRAGVLKLNDADTFEKWSEAWAFWYR